jgi:RimJ/RimL family protein N-acetyltransferase
MEDADLLLRWRNDPATRRASRNSAVISKSEHLAWLSRSLQDKSRKLYIAETNGRPVGTIRTDEQQGACELSWTVAPEMRGRGLGKKMVALAAHRIKVPLRAAVKSGNSASVRIAEHAGMKLEKEKNGFLYFQRPAQAR